MASITSLSNSSYNTSSIYGNRNVLSGLASGMDTETMIENAVSGIKLKIQNLQKKRTKIEWQQEAYRSIIDKAVSLNQKYTSYASKTNLMSNSFFANAVNTATLGTYKDKVSATGKTSSNIKLNAVKQLATATSYTVSGLGGAMGGDISAAVGGKKFDITGDIPVSTVSGSLTFQYGGTNGTTFDISFDELENLNEVVVKNADGSVKENASNAEKLAQAINNKLGEITYSYTKNGVQEITTADKAVKVTANPDGRIVFSDGLGNGNTVKISSSSGKLKALASENVLTSPGELTKDTKAYSYLSDKTLGITYNGSTKNISLDKVIKATNVSEGADSTDSNKSFLENLQKELDSAFGSGKITVGQDADNKLTFTPSGKGDTLSVGGSAVKALGFENGDSNFINTSKKLKDLAGDLFTADHRLKPVGSVNTSRLVDAAGNRVKLHDDGNYYRVNADNQFLYDFKVNGTSIPVAENTTLESLMNSINSNAEAGVKVSYSKLTNEFKFTATETGANGKIEFGGMAKDLFGPPSNAKINHNFAENYGFPPIADGRTPQITVKFNSKELRFNIDDKTTMQDFADEINKAGAEDLKASYNEETGQFTVTDRNGVEQEFTVEVGGTVYEREIQPLVNYTTGRDAIMDVEINGVRFENLTRSSNTFDIDGLNITVKGEFTTGTDKDGRPEEAVTFSTTTDSDKIVEAIRSFVDDYNEMITELKNAYSTLPAEKSNGARYEPLTAEEEDGYSESELKAYNEKAKQGILFGDTTLSGMYSKLLNSIQPGGSDGQTLREIGIGTSYSSGLTTISLDEDKLRSALESDPDKVKNAFAKTKEGGSATDGLMKTMQNTLEAYVKTNGEPKGVLITRAGSIKAPTSLNSNSLKSQMDSIDSQIDRWTDKMADQIDRYTSKFSKLEQLIAEMNSQASALSGLMMGGGSGGY